MATWEVLEGTTTPSDRTTSVVIEGLGGIATCVQGSEGCTQEKPDFVSIRLRSSLGGSSTASMPLSSEPCDSGAHATLGRSLALVIANVCQI